MTEKDFYSLTGEHLYSINGSEGKHNILAFPDVPVFAMWPWHMIFLWLYIWCEILAYRRLGQWMTYSVGAGSTSVAVAGEGQGNSVGKGSK